MGRIPESPNLAIRAAQTKDLAGLTETLADSFHSRSGLMRFVYPLLWMGIYEDLRNRLRSASPHYVCLVAVSAEVTAEPGVIEDECIVGTVEMALRPTHPWQRHQPRYLYLSNLAVRSEYRRQGVAHRLLLRCEDIALKWGFDDLYLHVLENNYQARRLYLKAGYQLQQAEPSWNAWFLRQPRRLFLHKHLSAIAPHSSP